MPKDDSELVDALLELVTRLDPVTEQALQAVPGTTLVQLTALRVLADGPTSVSGLARVLDVHRSTTSRLCDRLVAAGLVTREPSATSGREVVVALTPTGRRAVQAVGRRRTTELRRWARAVPERRRSAVAAALRELTTPAPSRRS